MKPNFDELDLNLYAPISGQLLGLKQLADPLFKHQMMGVGFAITPRSFQLLAPITGELVFSTGESALFQRSDGLQVYLQVGIDTAVLNGAPFVHLVAPRSWVFAKTAILTIDLKAIRAAHLAPTVILTLPNLSTPLADLRMQNHCVKAGTRLCAVKFS